MSLLEKINSLPEMVKINGVPHFLYIAKQDNSWTIAYTEILPTEDETMALRLPAFLFFQGTDLENVCDMATAKTSEIFKAEFEPKQSK